MNSELKRIFISIDIPENIKKEIRKIQKQLPEFYGKIIETENLHLTLKFLGEINKEKIRKIREKLKTINFRNFNAEISEIGVFSENYIRIIWLRIKNCDELQEKIDNILEEFGFEKEKRFMSHLTIARVKKINNKNKFLSELEKIKIPKLSFNITNFRLKESVLYSKRAYYKNIEIYNLK